MKRRDPPVTQQPTNIPAKDDTITAARVSAEMTTIDNYWVADASGKMAPSKGELVLGLYLNLSHVLRSKKVRSVYGIHQEGRVGDSRFRWEGTGQGCRTGRCLTEVSPTWKS